MTVRQRSRQDKLQNILGQLTIDSACNTYPLQVFFHIEGFAMAKGKMKYLMEPLFEELKKDYCYVCCQRITDDGVYIGQNKWRHKKCKPGSTQWLKSPLSKDDTTLPVLKTV